MPYFNVNHTSHEVGFGCKCIVGILIHLVRSQVSLSEVLIWSHVKWNIENKWNEWNEWYK